MEEVKRYRGTCIICQHLNTMYDYKGNIKIAYFTNMYCTYCLKETPHKDVVILKEELNNT